MIKNLYQEIMNSEKLENEIEEIIISLDEIKRNQMIDIVHENYFEDKIITNKENFQTILKLLSKYDYYKEKLFNYLNEKNLYIFCSNKIFHWLDI